MASAQVPAEAKRQGAGRGAGRTGGRWGPGRNGGRGGPGGGGAGGGGGGGAVAGGRGQNTAWVLDLRAVSLDAVTHLAWGHC
jgi:hypothetical protein